MQQKTLVGTLISGFGLATESLSPLYEAIREKSGLQVVEGTLNVQLDAPYIVIPDVVLDARKHDHHETIMLQRCTVMDLPGLILRTNTQAVGESHGLDILEVMTVDRLRTTRRLSDGDPIEIRVERWV
jgi:CTP-dependent riboflavin kinase